MIHFLQSFQDAVLNCSCIFTVWKHSVNNVCLNFVFGWHPMGWLVPNTKGCFSLLQLCWDTSWGQPLFFRFSVGGGWGAKENKGKIKNTACSWKRTLKWVKGKKNQSPSHLNFSQTLTKKSQQLGFNNNNKKKISSSTAVLGWHSHSTLHGSWAVLSTPGKSCWSSVQPHKCLSSI